MLANILTKLNNDIFCIILILNKLNPFLTLYAENVYSTLNIISQKFDALRQLKGPCQEKKTILYQKFSTSECLNI